MIQTQFKGIIQVLRTDNGTEYTEGSFESYLSSHGIIHQTTCVRTSEQNGVAERKNGHLLEVARSIMFTMHVPSFFWGDAVLTASFLINRLPSTILQSKTPASFLPNTSTHPLPLRIFGSVCFVHNSALSRGKLDPRALKCVFLGYSSTQKGYKCFHPPTRRIYVSHDVTFWESVSYYPSDSRSSLQGEKSSEGLNSEPEPSSVPTCEIQGEHTSDPKTLPRQEEREVLPNNGESSKLGKLNGPDLLTYSRRQRGTATLPPQLSVPEVNPTVAPSSELPGNPSELDLPIALRKGARTCTQHPISNFVSYNSVSSSYRAFVYTLSSVSIPQY